MRILFAGSPSIAVPALEAISGEGAKPAHSFELAGVLTNPDSPRGRSGTAEPTEIGAAAQRISALSASELPILKPEKLDGKVREAIAALKPDLLVSFAYGKIFGPKFLALFPMGGINIHPSLLPKYRGPTPIQAAILNRDSETGISIQKLAPQMDSGDILVQERIALSGAETAGSLSEVMAQKAAELLLPLLKKIAEGTAQAAPQNHSEASYCSLITAEDGLIDWNKSAAEIEARVRAFSPWPLSWTLHSGLRLFILKACVAAVEQPGAAAEADAAGGRVRPAAGLFQGTDLMPAHAVGRVLGTDKKLGILIQTGEGILAVTELQYQARKALGWRDFLNGARNFTGARLE